MNKKLTFAVLVMLLALAGMALAETADSTKPAEVTTTTSTTAIQTTATEATPSKLTAEIQVCTSVEDRVAVGAGDVFGTDVEQVCLWSKILGATDETTVKHVWFYDGKEMASVELPVRSASWRTWSRKTILPEWTGDWEVKVVDADGSVIASTSFKMMKAQEKTGQ